MEGRNFCTWNAEKQEQAGNHLHPSVTTSDHNDSHRIVAVALLPLSKSCPIFSTNSNSNRTEKGTLGNTIPVKPSWYNKYSVSSSQVCDSHSAQFLAPWERLWLELGDLGIPVTVLPLKTCPWLSCLISPHGSSSRGDTTSQKVHAEVRELQC